MTQPAPITIPVPPRATSVTITPPAPVTITPPAPEPVWGYPAPLPGANAGAWQAVNAAAGPLGCWRGYASGVPSTWPGTQGAPMPPGAVPIVSIGGAPADILDGSLDAKLVTWFSFVPEGAVVSWGHEYEAHQYGFTAADILACHEHCYELFEDHASPGASYVQIWTAFSATCGRVTPFASPVVDGHFADVYMTSAADTVAGKIEPWLEQVQAAPGMRADISLGIAETNAAQPAWRPGWIAETWAWAESVGASAWCLFCDAPGYAWDPADLATIAAIKAITAQAAT